MKEKIVVQLNSNDTSHAGKWPKWCLTSLVKWFYLSFSSIKLNGTNWIAFKMNSNLTTDYTSLFSCEVCICNISCKAHQGIMLCRDYQLNSSIYPLTCCFHPPNRPNLTLFLYFWGWNLSFVRGTLYNPRGGRQICLLLPLWIFHPNYCINPFNMVEIRWPPCYNLSM